MQFAMSMLHSFPNKYMRFYLHSSSQYKWKYWCYSIRYAILFEHTVYQKALSTPTPSPLLIEFDHNYAHYTTIRFNSFSLVLKNHVVFAICSILFRLRWRHVFKTKRQKEIYYNPNCFLCRNYSDFQEKQKKKETKN